MFSFEKPLKDFCYTGTIECFIFNFNFLFKKCYDIESRKKFYKNRLHTALASCDLVTESQSISNNICLNYWRFSLFIFHRFINVLVLRLSVLSPSFPNKLIVSQKINVKVEIKKAAQISAVFIQKGANLLNAALF